MRKLNNWLAEKITAGVGSMPCAYLFAVLGCVAMYGAFTGNVKLTLIAGSISGYFLQLVLLPVIIVGQNLQAAKHDDLAQSVQALHQKHDELSAKLGITKKGR